MLEARIKTKELMMKDIKRLVFTLVVIGVVTICIDYLIKLERKSSDPKFTELQVAYIPTKAPAPQTATERIWKEVFVEKELELDATIISKPQRLQVDSSGNLYVLDWRDRSIKMFSPSGAFMKSFGASAAGEPSRLNNPTEFGVSRSGSVWVCDPKQKRIIEFGVNGEVVNSIVPQSAVDRVALVKDVVVTSGGRDALFEIYSHSGKQEAAFGVLIESQAKALIALDGYVTPDSDGEGFFFGGPYLGLLTRYDLQGKQTFSVHTIDQVALPRLQVMGNSVSLSPTTPTVIRALSVAGDQIYVLSKSNADAHPIDVYDRRNGQYQFSVKFPQPCRYATVSTTKIYTISNDRVQIWRWHRT
jgi:hypothetical protein